MDTQSDVKFPKFEVSLADQWQRCLQEQRHADLESFIADHPKATPRDIADVVLIDQQDHWQAEPGPRVEEYLMRLPSLADFHDGLLDLVYGEVRACSRLGFSFDVERIIARFRQLEEPLRKQFELAEWIGDGSSAAVSTQSTSAGLMPGSSGASAVHHAASDDETDFGEYRLIERIGRGGMGVIYRAQHRRLDRTVAIKMLSIDRLSGSEEFQRFQNEIFAVARFDHPNILPIYEVGECDGTPFFTTRLIERGSLADSRHHFQNQPKTIARLAAAMARAVHHAHQRGVLHRDLKPSNVLIDEHDLPLIADFGLAQLLHGSSELTRTGDFVGTAA